MKFKRLLSYVLCFVFLFTCIAFPPSSPVAEASVLDDLKQQENELAQKIEANKARLDSLKADKSKQEEYLRALEANIEYTKSQLENLDKQINITQAQITEVENTVKNLEAEIEKLNSDIDNMDAEIKEAEKNVQITYAALSARLRSAYISGSDSNLKLLLGSDNITTFMRRLELMKRTSENDSQLINDFKAKAQVLEITKSSLEERTALLAEKQKKIQEENQFLYEKRAELNESKKQLNIASKNLEDQYKEVQRTIASLDRNSAYYQNLIAQQERERAEAEKAISDYIAAHASTGSSQTPTVDNGKFIFPIRCPGAHLTSTFGNRVVFGATNNHGGIDISAPGIYGQNIYASRAGKVLKADSSCATTYGKYILLDHGDGFTTIYAHCSELLVRDGQYVNQGDVIARVGSTGRSTGPHLHFEVRYNNVRQDPLNYVSVP